MCHDSKDEVKTLTSFLVLQVWWVIKVKFSLFCLSQNKLNLFIKKNTPNKQRVTKKSVLFWFYSLHVSLHDYVRVYF